MANLPISGLTASTSNLAGTDVLPVVQTTGVGPVQMSGLQLAGGLLGSTALTGATITTSQPVLNLSQTWNAGAVTFTGLKFNATDTASASGSLLLDLQVGGSTRTYVRKDGAIFFSGNSVTAGACYVAPYVSNGNSITFVGPGFFSNGTSNNAGFFDARYSFVWNANNGSSYAPDLYLSRAAAASLQLGAADAASPVAQTLQVQSVVAGTSGNVAGTDFTISGSRGVGSGAGGSIVFKVAPAGTAGATTQNALATALTINANKTVTLDNGSVGAPSVNFGDSTTGFYRPAARTIGVAVNGTSFVRFDEINGLSIRSDANIGWSSSSSWTAYDVLLFRDAANTLALRNSTNAQLFRVYSSYSSVSTNAFGGIGAAINLDGTAGDANTLYIGSQKTGSPTALTKLALQVDGTTRGDYGVTNATSWSFNATMPSGGAASFNISVNNSSTDFVNITNLLAPNNTTAGHRCCFNLGVSNSTNNVASHFFKYAGSGSTSNSFGVVFYGGSPVWEVTAAGNATLTGNLNFAGTTSSFPALKRSTTTLQVRLADDSANAALTCGTTTSSGTALNVTGTGDASILSVTNTTTGTLLDVVNSSGSSLLTVADTPAMTLIDAMTIAVGTSTGTKIGTATGQKLAFWNATPVAQQVLATGASKTVDDVITLLQTLGLCKQS